jgi:hypothetical protein
MEHGARQDDKDIYHAYQFPIYEDEKIIIKSGPKPYIIYISHVYLVDSVREKVFC